MDIKINDVIVSKEILILFKNSVRIVDKKHLAGIFPIDHELLAKLRDKLPELFNDSILKRYDIAIGYQGRAMKADFMKFGIDEMDKRIVNNIIIRGIPVPWQLLKKANIYNEKLNIYLTPKQQVVIK